jgi:hypothetical protein
MTATPAAIKRPIVSGDMPPDDGAAPLEISADVDAAAGKFGDHNVLGARVGPGTGAGEGVTPGIEGGAVGV